MFSLLLLLSLCSSLFGKYHSQFGQDEYLNDTVFHNKRGGVFLDIGAYDGITLSNTHFFEKELGWTGICVEPMDAAFAHLSTIRACHCINGCVAPVVPANGLVDFIEVTGGADMLSGMKDTYDPRHHQRLLYEMQAFKDSRSTIVKKKAYTLHELLEKYNINTIDYISLDIEGGELEILQSIDFSRFNIHVIDVENNYNDPAIRSFLESKGFVFLHKMNVDEVFINPHFAH